MKDKYKTLIISCWVVLLCCFVVKLLGGNFFEIVCENEKYIAFTTFCNKGIPYWIITIVFYLLQSILFFMAVCKLNKPKWWMIVATVLFFIVKQIFYKYQVIVFIAETLFMILLPLIHNKKLILRSIIAYVLVFAFQLISLVIKNIGIKILYYDSFTAMIFSIDYYIMLVLYWLYSIKEETTNGTLWIPIFRFRRQRKHQ